MIVAIAQGEARAKKGISRVLATGTGRPIDAIIAPVAPYAAPPDGMNNANYIEIVTQWLLSVGNYDIPLYGDYPVLVIPKWTSNERGTISSERCTISVCPSHRQVFLVLTGIY